MPKVRPLCRDEAIKSLANRLAPRIDRIRQIATNLGTRPYRVFLTWTTWTGTERGEGYEQVVRRTEILPTPLVASLDRLALTQFAAGTLPMGSVQVTEVSATLTEDLLTGRWVPEPHEDEVPPPKDFFYEVVEDGRGDPEPVRWRFRLMSKPFRDAENVQWKLLLEKEDPDRSRDDRSPFAFPGRR